mgnify:CR=1 FL=1
MIHKFLIFSSYSSLSSPSSSSPSSSSSSSLTDVATRNVLLSSDLRAKISDFGLSREGVEDSLYYQSRGGKMPIRWTAPEALEHHRFSTASDIWAFGVMLYEIWTKAETPYHGWTNQRVWVEVIAGFRLPKVCLAEKK